MQFGGHRGGIVAAIAGLAPSQAGAIVGAHPRHLRDVGLHPAPRGRHAGRGRFEDDRRRALADAIEMKLMAADVDEASGMRKLPPFERGRRALVGGAGEHEEHEDHGGGDQDAAHPREDHAHQVRRQRASAACAARATP